MWCASALFFFFFNDTATTEIYTLSLHHALPICTGAVAWRCGATTPRPGTGRSARAGGGRLARPGTGRLARPGAERSEEHTSELQSRQYLVCRLLLEKKKNINRYHLSQVL